MAAILELSLEQILQEHPKVFKRVMRDPRILGSCYEIEVLESVFRRQKLVTCTTDFLPSSHHEANESWTKEVYSENKSSSLVKVKAIAMTVPYPKATQLACGGLFHPSLLQGVHQNTYESLIVEAIVDYKWKYNMLLFLYRIVYSRLYGAKFMIDEVVQYLCLLIVYMLYCFMICIDGAYKIKAQEGNEINSNATKFSLILCWILAIPCLYRKILQCVLHARYHGMHGCLFWLFSTWNTMKLISYSIIVVVLPLLQFVFLKEGKKSIPLSVVVGAECVLLWCHVLYYVRVSRKLGKYVTVITEVVVAVIPFLFIAFCVMFGFAVAFHVLYRHVDTLSLESTCEECEDDELLSLQKSFGTFGRTLFTVFGYAFGQFDLDDIYHAPNVYQLPQFYLSSIW